MAQAPNRGGEVEQPTRDIGKILLIGYLSLNLTAMAIGSFLVYRATVGYETPAARSAALDREIASFRASLQDRPLVYTLDQFNTNLNGIPRRLIRVEMNLEMLDAEGFEEIILSGPQAKDAVVRILNAKSFDDVESVQGKLHLKNEIIAQLNGLLERGVVKDIYFSDFVVQ